MDFGGMRRLFKRFVGELGGGGEGEGGARNGGGGASGEPSFRYG